MKIKAYALIPFVFLLPFGLLAFTNWMPVLALSGRLVLVTETPATATPTQTAISSILTQPTMRPFSSLGNQTTPTVLPTLNVLSRAAALPAATASPTPSPTPGFPRTPALYHRLQAATPSPTPSPTPDLPRTTALYHRLQAVTPSPTPGPLPYRLRQGDTMQKIAVNAAVPLADLLALNQCCLTGQLRQGQVITLPSNSIPPERWPAPTPKAYPTFTTDQPPTGSPLIHLGNSARRFSDGRKQVALTFDIGYYPQITTQIAQLLAQRGVHATFFIIGSTAETNPQMVRAIISNGHQAGNHSFSHKDMTQMTADEIRSELLQAELAVERTSPGTTTKPFFRAPFGYVNATVMQTAQAEGYYVVDWSVDGLDWLEDIAAEEIVWTVTRTLQPGAIFCLHGSSQATLEALPDILDQIEAEGYAAVTLSELFEPGKNE